MMIGLALVPFLITLLWLVAPLIVGLMLGGLALSLTSAFVAWRFLRGKVRSTAAEPVPLSRSA